jgi:hypothetical protein
MRRVCFSLVFLLFLEVPVRGERVISRERSFIVPSLVVRQEVKRETNTIQVKIPVSSPKIISLDSYFGPESHKLQGFANNVIIARPTDLVFLNIQESKFAHNSFYSIHGASYFIADGPINLPKTGTHQLTYYSFDFFGNRDSGKNKILLIDGVAPKLSIRFLPEPKQNEDKLFCDEKTIVYIDASDLHSGIRSIFWKVSTEENWKRYENSIALDFNNEDESMTVQSYAVDLAGNNSLVESNTCLLSKSSTPAAESGNNLK